MVGPEDALKSAARASTTQFGKPLTALAPDLRYSDFTIRDFAQLTEDGRLTVLATVMNELMKASTLLVLRPGVVYSHGEQLRSEVFSFFEIPESLLRTDKEALKKRVAISTGYYDFLDIRRRNRGSLTKVNLASKVVLVDSLTGAERLEGYTLTSFGAQLKGFVEYLLVQCAQSGTNPKKLLGAMRGKEDARSPVRTSKILDTLNHEPSKSFKLLELMPDIAENHTALSLSMTRLSRLGLVVFMQHMTARQKAFQIDRGALERVLEHLPALEHWKTFAELPLSVKHQIGIDTIAASLRKIYVSGVERIDSTQLSTLIGRSEKTAKALIRVMDALDVTALFAKITPLGEQVAKRVIAPMIAVAEDPAKLGAYSGSLSRYDKGRLLDMYSSSKRERGTMLTIAYNALPNEGPGITTGELAEMTRLNLSTARNKTRMLLRMELAIQVSPGRWRRTQGKTSPEVSALIAARREGVPRQKLATR